MIVQSKIYGQQILYIMSIKHKSVYLLTLCIALLTQLTNADCSSPMTTNCDPRCISCTVINNQNQCCKCIDKDGGTFYYLNRLTGVASTAAARCAPTCPTGYYGALTFSTADGTNKCMACDYRCQTCTAGSNTDCITCTSTTYLKGSTSCYIESNSPYNPCPAGYLGIYYTMKCQPCPTGCATCSISIRNNMPSQMPSPYAIGNYVWSTNCTGDGLCTYAVECYSCDTSSYVLEEGLCITRNRCRKYSLYNSTTSGFNSAYCYCKPNFYLTGVTSCSICHWSCQNCSGSADTNCGNCHVGAKKSGGLCVANDSYVYISKWNNSLPTSGVTVGTQTWTKTQNNLGAAKTSPCSQANGYLFGYYGYDSAYNSQFGNASLRLISTHTSLSLPHYAIHFKGIFLFIDQWDDGTYVNFQENGIQKYSYRYSMNQIIGQYFCGRATHDHHDAVQFTFPHTRADLNLFISVASAKGFQWGLKNVVVGVLKCDPSCATCDGPTQADCLTCITNQVLIDGDCVCDIKSITDGYYNESGTCVTNCSGGKYMNPYTRTCTADCSATTYLFKHIQTDGKKYCLQNCPVGYWKLTANMSCVDDCFDGTLPVASRYYNFDGQDKVCYQSCPDGYYGDPESHNCVTLCPATPSTTDNPNIAYYVQGKICVLYCDSVTYAYHPNRTCLSSCPTGFYKNKYDVSGTLYNICQDQCTVTLDGKYKFGDNTTGWCVDYCPTGGWADSIVHLCLANCNSTAYKQTRIVTGGFTENSCQMTCDSSGNGYYGNPFNMKCVSALNCPQNTYGDSHTTFCEPNCTNALQFGDNLTQTCQTSCSNNAFKQNFTKRCVVTCPVGNSTAVPQFGDHIFQNHYCKTGCISVAGVNTYADAQFNRQCVYVCKASPVATFGLNNVCVFNCSATTWGDANNNRTCTTSCTWSSGGTQTYGYNQTRMCVATCPDTEFGQVIGGIPLCVYVCEIRATGTFGNPDTNLCVDKCPSPYYGDPTGNRTCVQQCASLYFAQNTTAAGVLSDIRICVQTCDYGWADNTTRKCATAPTGCSAGLYAHQTNHKCVLPADCTGFADPVTQKCVPVCFFNATVTYYGDPSTKNCVLICPDVPDYYGDNNTHQCRASCSLATQAKDPQYKRRCVTACSRTPLALFFDAAAGTCVTTKNCTTNTYADNFTNKCQSNCQGTLNQYADPVSGECVKQCQLGWYGYNRSVADGICVQRCPLNQWADNLTVQCTTRCSTNTYGVNYTAATAPTSYGICQSQCPEGQWARDTDNLCVPNCLTDPSGNYLWGNNDTNKCVATPFGCPVGTYADNATSMCVYSTGCSIVGVSPAIQYVADNTSQSCLPECPPLTSTNLNWADMAKKLCVAVCPHNYYGFNATKKCQTQCRLTAGGAWPNPAQFADPQNQLCVSICSAYPRQTFGELTTYTCVQASYCPGQTWAEIQVNIRRCVATCPMANSGLSIPQKYADNITKTCVTTCPTYFFGDLQRGYGMCVSTCPSTNESTPQLQFSDNFTKTCVTICPISQNTFGDVVSLSCVLTCPLTYFAQQNPVRHCVTVCATNTWGNAIRRFCQTTPTNCPTVNGSHYYADNSSHLCVKVCPIGQNTWGQNSTWVCQLDCVTGFKMNGTRVCIDICPPNLDGDGSFSDAGMCYFVCMTPNYYRDPQNARSCQPACSFSPVKYYKDVTTMKCVLSCPVYPQYYYAYDPGKQCRTDCPGAYMRDPVTRTCKTTCPTNTFYDANSDQCVQDCSSQYSAGIQYFGDTTFTIPKCVIATDCSPNLFADSHVGLCVSQCTDSQWKYGKLCITHCPDGYYGNYNTGYCVTPSNCPSNNYAENYTRTCVPRCNGTYADTSLKVCVDICPTNYFADPVTRLCSTTCTDNATIQLHRNFQNKTCVSSCNEFQYLNPLNNTCEDACNDPYYSDRTTQMCVSTCPSVPPLFGDDHLNKCVEQCDDSPLQYKYIPDRTCVGSCPVGYYRDNLTRFCVQQCVNVTYADSDRGYCVYNCSPKYSLDDPINVCTSLCPLPYYRDPTTFKCVESCPTSPARYYKAIVGNDNYCSVNCPTNQYRDLLSFACVSICPPSPPTFADPSTDNCVAVCPSNPTDLYAHIELRTCVSRCPDGMFAQNKTRTCVAKCPNGSDLYADNSLSIPYCVHLCSPGLFADPYTLTCVGNCNKNPQTYGFSDTTTRICLANCPYPYVADNTSYTCVIYCGSTDRPYLDKASKSCVMNCSSLVYRFSYMPLNQLVNGTCVDYCPGGFFAHLPNSSCVSRCPTGFYGDIKNYTCYQNCTLANNRFADDMSNMCVDVCPYNGSYDSYGDLFSRKCVTTCPTDKFTVKDTNTRLCEPSCTEDDEYIDFALMKCVASCSTTPLMFADPVSQSCVSDCSLYSKRYGYTTTRICVEQCPVSGLYANDQLRLCVSATQCPTDMFGLDPERICVEICPTDRDYYGDETTHMCVGTCPVNYYADPSTRLCVQTCPSVPSLYGKLPNKVCVPFCTGGEFADNQTRRCSATCSITPLKTFADNSTYICVQKCPSQPDFFSENQTYTCTSTCPTTPAMFADESTRTCVKYCPKGNFPTFAYVPTRRCLKTCPSTYYMQNSTGTCQTQCSQGYADPQTKYCIGICPHYTYGLYPERTCVPGCPTATPQLYAQDNTNLCESACLEIYETFKDDTTNRCVKICPISADLYAEPINRKCVGTCLSSPKQFKDFSTRYCVETCPMIPSLFGENTTQTCVSQCPNQTYADKLTRLCVSICPSAPTDTYGDNSTWTCVSYCPSQPYTWADDFSRTCVPICPTPPDYYADNNTGRCQTTCTQGTFADSTTRRCVQTCPLGYFGRNATGRCVTGCQTNQFADHLLRLCVKKCSVNPIFYGNPDTHNCTDECPNTTFSFGNPLTQECVKYLPNGRSGCPNYYYSDNTSRLCVPKCPLKNDTYGDNSTWKCVAKCPAGSENTFSDNSTMMCVQVCPSYPQFYAEQYSRRCVSLCLQANSTYKGSFADNSTRKCVQTCPSTPDYYSDNSTRRCVFYCPHEPLTFADYWTRRCVSTCPSTPDLYGDPKTLRCVLVCPQEQSTYAEPNTRLCVKVCPSSYFLFGNNDTNRCVPYTGCPNGTYADNSSRLCVRVCPEYPDTYGDPSTKRCVSICPQSPDLYADPFSQTCVLRCPDGTYAQNDTRRCLPQCPKHKMNYADNVTNRCVSLCPVSNATYGDNSTQKCVYQCPDTPFTYADNMTRKCLTICNNVSNSTVEGGYAQNQTRVCVLKCPELSYGNILTRYCVRYCPQGLYAYTESNMCVQRCPPPFFADNSTWDCVMQCPVSQLLFGQPINRTCTYMCPPTTYADSYSQQCVYQCPGVDHDTFAYQGNRTCVQQCPIPLYGYPVTWVCIPQCLNPYYENITDHRCYKCPDECAECTYPQNCLFCVPDHYLYSGRCLQSCPTFPTITYANPNGVCGTAFQCTAGYFALNTTKSCVQNCPSGYYKNSTLQACDSCLSGCAYCLNSSSCITCNTTIALWDDNKCYVYCSPMRRYYTSTGCVTACPTGYYLQLVTCQACSSICKACIVQPQNCLTCADGYYLSNNLCVQKCPDNTKAVLQNNMLYCKSCALVDCTVTPLTYDVTQYVQDYNYKFRIKFSEKVNITEQIDQVIRIRQKTVNRRLMQITYTYLDYTIIDYGNGEYVIILNNFDARQNSDMQFSFQITNPQAIVSPSGQFPQKTRSTIIIKSTDFYSINDYNPHPANYCMIVAIVVVILLALTFCTNQSIWMPVIDFFHLLFALLFVNMVMPPTPAYAISKAKILILSFLPNMFDNSLPKSQYDKTISSMIFTFFGDMIFVRTMGFLYTILLVMVVVFVIMLLLWKKGKWKNIKAFCKSYLKQTLWRRDIHGFVYLFFFPTLVIGLMKMRNYKTSKPIEGFSIFSSFVFMIPMIATPFYFAYKIFRLFRDNPSTCEMLKKGYNYICSREVILDINPIYFFTNDKNQVDLKQLSKPRINQILILPYPIETRFGAPEVAMPIVQYFYKFMIAFVLVVAFDNGAAQLFLMLLLTLLNIIYYAAVKPYIHISEKQYNNYLVLFNLVLFSCIVIVMAALQLQSNSLSYSSRVIMGSVLAGLVILSMTVNAIYFIFRAWGWYHDYVWKPFVYSEVFKENYTLQYWDYKKQYEKLEKDIKGKHGIREEFLNAIKLENKLDGLQSMIKRDPNESKSKDKKEENKNINLRPNRNQQLKKQITNMFQTFNDEKEKSHKSIKSSQRLSKQDRNKVRNIIFGQKDLKAHKDEYQPMKIEQKSEQHQEQLLEEEETEYEYEYIEQEYPQGTDMNQIMKNCKKGDIVLH